MHKQVIAFRKGLRIFWEQEVPQVMQALATMAWGVAVTVWLFFPYPVVLASLLPKAHVPDGLVYSGLAGLASQVIAVAVLFVRHVLRLASESEDTDEN